MNHLWQNKKIISHTFLRLRNNKGFLLQRRKTHPQQVSLFHSSMACMYFNRPILFEKISLMIYVLIVLPTSGVLKLFCSRAWIPLALLEKLLWGLGPQFKNRWPTWCHYNKTKIAVEDREGPNILHFLVITHVSLDETFESCIKLGMQSNAFYLLAKIAPFSNNQRFRFRQVGTRIGLMPNATIKCHSKK